MKMYVVYDAIASVKRTGKMGIYDLDVQSIFESREDAIKWVIEDIRSWKDQRINDPEWVDDFKTGNAKFMNDQELEKEDFSDYVVYFNFKNTDFCLKKIDCIEFDEKRMGL